MQIDGCNKVSNHNKKIRKSFYRYAKKWKCMHFVYYCKTSGRAKLMAEIETLRLETEMRPRRWQIFLRRDLTTSRERDVWDRKCLVLNSNHTVGLHIHLRTAKPLSEPLLWNYARSLRIIFANMLIKHPRAFHIHICHSERYYLHRCAVLIICQRVNKLCTPRVAGGIGLS